MPSPIVSLPTLEQIVPEHCCPLWRNDTNATIYGNVQCTEVQKRAGIEKTWHISGFKLRVVYCSNILTHMFLKLDNYNKLFLATLAKTY